MKYPKIKYLPEILSFPNLQLKTLNPIWEKKGTLNPF